MRRSAGKGCASPFLLHREIWTCLWDEQNVHPDGKQHNRGQDGAGIANIKLTGVGLRYISRYRSMKSQPVAALFKKKKSEKKYHRAQKEGKEKFRDEKWL